MNIPNLINYGNKLKSIGQKDKYLSIMNYIKNFFEHIDINKLTTQDIQIVVARYNEDLDWLNNYRKWIIVYNKGKRLKDEEKYYKVYNIKNVGRESHTYLYHIINNWDNLSNNTLFIQGKSYDHDNFINIKYYLLSQLPITINLSANKLDIETNNRIKYNKKWTFIKNNSDWKESKYNFKTWWNKYIQKTLPSIRDFYWSPGAFFSIRNSIIKNKSKNYYEKLIETISDHINPEEGHYFERSWYYIFT